MNILHASGQRLKSLVQLSLTVPQPPVLFLSALANMKECVMHRGKRRWRALIIWMQCLSPMSEASATFKRWPWLQKKIASLRACFRSPQYGKERHSDWHPSGEYHVTCNFEVSPTHLEDLSVVQGSGTGIAKDSRCHCVAHTDGLLG